MLTNFYLAGAVGIEPTQTVLETVVLPLYDAPTCLKLCEENIKKHP